jgi:replicative DNA helicase
VALSQLSRAIEAREMPKLSDLRESGALEQDADVIMFLFRKEDRPDAEKNTTELWVGKQRNGPTGSIQLVFKTEYTRFEDLAPASRRPQQF